MLWWLYPGSSSFAEVIRCVKWNGIPSTERKNRNTRTRRNLYNSFSFDLDLVVFTILLSYIDLVASIIVNINIKVTVARNNHLLDVQVVINLLFILLDLFLVFDDYLPYFCKPLLLGVEYLLLNVLLNLHCFCRICLELALVFL